MWNILGITPTSDEDVIKTAYRGKLVSVNPEEDPEGFKELRQAYEEAVSWAKKAKKKKNPLEQWMYEIEQIYENLYRRIDADEWEGIFENEICSRFNIFAHKTIKQIKAKLVGFEHIKSLIFWSEHRFMGFDCF